MRLCCGSSQRQLWGGYKPVTALIKKIIQVYQCSNSAHPGACRHSTVAHQNDNYVQIRKLATAVNQEMTQAY
jgi:hypothetical protein